MGDTPQELHGPPLAQPQAMGIIIIIIMLPIKP
jgi:hypothetical protein